MRLEPVGVVRDPAVIRGFTGSATSIFALDVEKSEFPVATV
jgi:hypothetical protein